MIILSGCIREQKAERHFPEWAKNQCYGALNEAENIINKIGIHSISPKSVRVEFVAGTKRYGNRWAWYVKEPSWPNGGMLVLGVCSGYLIKVGIDPNRTQDPNAIDVLTLIHEFVHHWLMRNGHGGNHYPEYDRYVDNWGHARRIVGLDVPESIWVTIDGVHYDVVVE